MKISRQFVTASFFFFVLFLSSGAMEAFTASGAASDNSSGSPMMKALWAAVYLVVLVMLLRRRGEVLEMVAANKAFASLVILAVLSVFWSIEPGATVAKGIPLLMSALAGMEFARRFTLREQLQIIWKVLALVMVLGVIVQVFFPGLVPQGGDDEMAATAWHGIVTAKNTWARLVVLTGVVILSLPRRTRRNVLSAGFLMVLIFALLIASESTGGLLIMVEMSVLFLLFGILRWRRRKALILLILSCAGIGIVVCNFILQNFTAFLAMTGKDPTMTGRLPIWRECMRFVRMKPLLGYGYAAFWTVSSRPARLIREAVNWDTLPHAHNGSIDLLLSLGCVGLFLYFLTNGIAGWRAVRYVRHNPEADAMWPLAFLAVIFLYQLDEATIVASNQLIWVLFSSVIFSLGIEARDLPAPQLPEEEESLTPELTAAD
ncbi:MAG: O-antigen ligase [Acidobacteriaceae bacterium]